MARISKYTIAALFFLLPLTISGFGGTGKVPPNKQNDQVDAAPVVDGQRAMPANFGEDNGGKKTPSEPDVWLIDWHAITSGGITSFDMPEFRVSGSAGQAVVGRSEAWDVSVTHGFWQDFRWTCNCVPGDANNDGSINVGDPVYIIAYIFKGGPAPAPYAVCSGDANRDCQSNVGDAVYLINFVFKGGPPPPDCETWANSCGSPHKE